MKLTILSLGIQVLTFLSADAIRKTRREVSTEVLRLALSIYRTIPIVLSSEFPPFSGVRFLITSAEDTCLRPLGGQRAGSCSPCPLWVPSTNRRPRRPFPRPLMNAAFAHTPTPREALGKFHVVYRFAENSV